MLLDLTPGAMTKTGQIIAVYVNRITAPDNGARAKPSDQSLHSLALIVPCVESLQCWVQRIPRTSSVDVWLSSHEGKILHLVIL